ncbi:hypothetical protein OIU84_023182, partial [Salix udensis]
MVLSCLWACNFRFGLTFLLSPATLHFQFLEREGRESKRDRQERQWGRARKNQLKWIKRRTVKKSQPTKKEKHNTEESVLAQKQEDAATDYKELSADDDSEDFKSIGDSEAGDGESSGDEGNHKSGSSEGLAIDGQSEDSEPDQGPEESDSSEDEVAPRNTVGDVPLEWYKDEKHIGYDIAGKKIKKKERQDKLDSFLANVDDSKN